MRALSWTGLFLALIAATVHAQDAGEAARFAEGVAAYEDGRFDEARTRFHELLLAGHHDGEVLFNLGNAAYRSGRFPEAVYAFEWARRALPGDERITENLELARAQLIVDEVSSDLAPAARAALEGLRRLPLPPLALAFVAAWSLGWLLLAWRAARGVKGATGPGFGFLLLAALLALPLGVRFAQATGPAEGVLLAPEVVVRSGPGDSYAALLELHAGTVLEQLEERSGWLRVRVPHGPGGWVPAGTLAVFGRPQTLPR